MNYLLTCESCKHEISVSPARAGGEVRCRSCETTVRVPKLGVLSGLPVAETAPPEPSKGRSMPGQIVFAAMTAAALLGLLAAAYCGVRWSMVDVPLTTEENVAQITKAYSELPAANLVLEWEDMEKYGIDVVGVHKYHALQKQKDSWANGAIYSGVAGGLALLIGLGAATLWRTDD